MMSRHLHRAVLILTMLDKSKRLLNQSRGMLLQCICGQCLYRASRVGKGAINIAFVSPFVAYIVNNSRTQTPSVPKFGMKVLHLRCNCTPVSRSNGQRSGLQTGGAYHVGRTRRPHRLFQMCLNLRLQLLKCW